MKKYYALICVAITSLLLVWAWRDVSFSEVFSILKEVDVKWFVLGLITFLSSFFIRAYRWGTLLEDQPNKGSFYIRLAAVFIGFAANQILPANAGELVRSGVLKRFSGISLSACVGSLFAARLLDAIVAFIFLFAPLIALSQTGTSLGGLPILGLGLLLFCLCMTIGTVARYPTFFAKKVGTVVKVLGMPHLEIKMVQRTERFLSGLIVFQSIRRTTITLFQTVCLWSISGITFWVSLVAFNLLEPGFTGALLVQSLEAMATIIPSTPGHLGAFEAAIRFGLSFYTVPANTIVAYTLLLRIIMNGGVLVVGAIFALQLGVRKLDVRK